jgi:hypothetical protein
MDINYFLQYLLLTEAVFCSFEFDTFCPEYLIRGLELCNTNYIVNVTYYVHLIDPNSGEFLSGIFTFELKSINIEDNIDTVLNLYNTISYCMKFHSGYTNHLIMYISDEPLKGFID